MSENGPYNQPPQNPYGGGDNSGSQPPYGPPHGAPYGDPGTGGQPPYGGPAGFPGPQEQQMYGGGQPPYGGGPGGPGYPPPPPQQPQGGGSKAGLWVVIGGGAVIIVLVIAVVVVLFTNDGGQQTVAPEPEPSPSAEATTGGEETTEPTTDAAPAGEPPYAVPAEPCDAFTDQVLSDFLIQDEGDKYVQDNNSYCESLEGAAPEGNPSESYAMFEISYQVPYSAADSVEAATTDFQSGVQELRGEGDYNTFYDSANVEEDKEVDLGDEAHYVLTKYDFLGEDIPEATLLIRTANLNIRVQYQMHPPFTEGASAEDLVMPDNVEELMLNAGAEALALVGS
ncbi:DUF3558 domain-containing protein [Nocardiopsis synnemataformans]|uniref:DUF3558 domain-containing protein n=1 Tax=Nocardiopsis synnemataformans TaxID=61305 RepID=UPI003EBFCC60